MFLHQIPHDTELSSEDKGWQRNKQQAKYQKRHRDNSAEERPRGYFTITNGGYR